MSYPRRAVWLGGKKINWFCVAADIFGYYYIQLFLKVAACFVTVSSPCFGCALTCVPSTAE